jgi:5-methylcytosine-specific restriction endonuclease McrA
MLLEILRNTNLNFELSFNARAYSKDELIEDIKKVARILRKDSVSLTEYSTYGKFNTATYCSRFGKWNNAVRLAGLNISTPKRISEEALFENLLEVWIKLGRQPFSYEMKRPLSRHCSGTYARRFGSWVKAVRAFVELVNEKRNDLQLTDAPCQVDNIHSENAENNIYHHLTRREVSPRLKVQVLIRDGNKCRICGIKVTGDNIHIDHIRPWSKGGETVLENLQVLCDEHNYQKGNYIVSQLKRLLPRSVSAGLNALCCIL